MAKVLILACFLCLSVPAAAQDDCNAHPRWLVVTVVYGNLVLGDGQSFEVSTGVQTLDRCEFAYSMSDVNSSSENPLQRRVWSLGARAEIVGSDYPRVNRYYVKETVHDICAAVDDCADATAGALER